MVKFEFFNIDVRLQNVKKKTITIFWNYGIGLVRILGFEKTGDISSELLMFVEKTTILLTTPYNENDYDFRYVSDMAYGAGKG